MTSLAWWEAADFEQLKPESLHCGEHAVQRRLVRERACQDGILPARLSPQGGERGAHGFTQMATHPDLIPPQLRFVWLAGHVTSMDAVRMSGHRTI